MGVLTHDGDCINRADMECLAEGKWRERADDFGNRLLSFMSHSIYSIDIVYGCNILDYKAFLHQQSDMAFNHPASSIVGSVLQPGDVRFRGTFMGLRSYRCYPELLLFL